MDDNDILLKFCEDLKTRTIKRCLCNFVNSSSSLTLVEGVACNYVIQVSGQRKLKEPTKVSFQNHLVELSKQVLRVDGGVTKKSIKQESGMSICSRFSTSYDQCVKHTGFPFI